MTFETKKISTAPEAIAPDGSEVRMLCHLSRGGLAVFSLPAQAVSKAVAHRTVEELWYVICGHRRMWRKFGQDEQITELGPGVSLSIPVGTQFQFRCDGPEPLTVVGATMPSWPSGAEAFEVEGAWPPEVKSNRGCSRDCRWVIAERCSRKLFGRRLETQPSDGSEGTQELAASFQGANPHYRKPQRSLYTCTAKSTSLKRLPRPR